MKLNCIIPNITSLIITKEKLGGNQFQWTVFVKTIPWWDVYISWTKAIACISLSGNKCILFGNLFALERKTYIKNISTHFKINDFKHTLKLTICSSIATFLQINQRNNQAPSPAKQTIFHACPLLTLTSQPQFHQQEDTLRTQGISSALQITSSIVFLAVNVLGQSSLER